MRTFTQKPKATQQTASAKSMIPRPTHFEQSRQVYSILPLQRTIGNQAVQRLFQANDEELNAASAATASTRFMHDFSGVPVHSNVRTRIQPMLTVNTITDRYEREADRVANEVIRVPEPQLQPACACAGKCPKCNEKRWDQENKQLQAKSIQPNDATETSVPRLVQNVLREPSHPLDQTTRNFMESRFGHDFSQVRVHTDAKAAESTWPLNALAYTLGRDIVLGPGQYAPNTHQGRRILAHELAHVVQQSRGGSSTAPAMSRDTLESSADHASSGVLNSTAPVRVHGIAPVGLMRQERPAPTRLSPDEMVSIILMQRGFTGKQQPKGEIGHGYETHALVQLVDKDGKVVAHELGGHVSGKAVEQAARRDVPRQPGERGKVHAERMAVAALDRRLSGGEIDANRLRGGRLEVAVDQVPCPASKKDCLGHLKRFAKRHGLKLEVYVPARPSAAGGGEVSPKTAARTVFTGPEVPGSKGGLGQTGRASVKPLHTPKPLAPKVPVPKVKARAGRGPRSRFRAPSLRGRSGQRGAAATEAIAAIAAIAIAYFLQRYYAKEVAEDAQRREQQSLDDAGPKIQQAIADHIVEIAEWQERGKPVFLFLVVEQDWQDTDIGRILMRSTVLNVSVGPEEAKPRPKDDRSIAASLVQGAIDMTIYKEVMAIPIGQLGNDVIEDILEEDAQRKRERQRRHAAAERRRKQEALAEMRKEQARPAGPAPVPREVFPSPGQAPHEPASPQDFPRLLQLPENPQARAARVADLFEAGRDELVQLAARLNRASERGEMTASAYEASYREFTGKRDAWIVHLKESIALFEKAGAGLYAAAIERLAALADWLNQVDGRVLFEVAPHPGRTPERRKEKRNVVAVDQAPMVPVEGGSNIRLAKNSEVVVLSKPMGQPAFVKIRVVKTGRVGWIQPRFVDRR